MRGEKSKMSKDHTWHFQICFENLLYELIFGLLRMQKNSKDPRVFLISISIQHDANILPQLCQCFHRLLSICIEINMTANAKPAISPFTWGIIPEAFQILSFVHWPRGVNYVCCKKTRRAPQVHENSSVGTLIDGRDAYQPQCVTDT